LASQANNSTFGQASASSQRPSPFGTAAASSPFAGATSNTAANPLASQQQPSAGSAFGGGAQRSNGQPLTSLKGQRIFYQDSLAFYNNPQTGKMERVWNPEGAPGPNPDVEASPETYEALGVALQQVYDYVRANGHFKDGIMPEVPPKREWVDWEL
jgi:nucleoporin NUP42